jgi:two-component system, response regulator FlrC
MLEAMLFGHEKGAYTGAHAAAPGKFEQANGGTLLLDEISELPLPLQAKLLRVLQEREVERLGGRKSIQLDVRVIATTNRDMREEVMGGRFREDLYFRLSVLPLQWAPLRDRKADILPLAQTLLARHSAKQHRLGVKLSDSAIDALLQYGWPGNVRELDNVMQRALILQPGCVIESEDLGLDSLGHFSEKPSLVDGIQAPGPVKADQIPLSMNIYSPPPDLTQPESMSLSFKTHEFDVIRAALHQVQGSKKDAARRLGISPRTLRYKMARLREEGLDVDA